MTFVNVTDSQLIESTRIAIEVETSAITNVVRHFREIFDRELHLARGYSSMFLMAREEFGYDKASAQRRVKAMELSLVVPTVLEKIDDGRLCLQSAADIQTFLDRERGAKKTLSLEEVRELVEICSGLSTRRIEIELASRRPDMEFRESKRMVAKDRVEIKYTSRLSIEEKLERIKQLRSHVKPYMTREELLDYMAEITLDAIDPVRRAERVEGRNAKKQEARLAGAESVSASVPAGGLRFEEEFVSNGLEVQLVARFDEATRYIDAGTRHSLHSSRQAKGCEYTDPDSGRRCGSRHQLQMDHVIEFARGGSNDLENLRLMCAQHNRWSWRRGRGNKEAGRSTVSEVREASKEYAA